MKKSKMVEGIKQMRVDNWGFFFLQKLNMFFNKTDYCDLTLQFEGNVHLKVHRLVINACTEYFNFLEQTCGLQGDVLIMPADLQADVILPIVNFMYTGLLEFHMSVFEDLYRVSALMNINVLTKLLDTLKKSEGQTPKPVKQNKKPVTTHSPSSVNTFKKSSKSESELFSSLSGKKTSNWKRKAVSNFNSQVLSNSFNEKKSQSHSMYDSTPKPTRFEWPEEELSTMSIFESSFDDISYTTKPLLTKEDDPTPSTSSEKMGKDNFQKSKLRSNLLEFNLDENSCESMSEGHKRKIDGKSDDSTSVKKVRFTLSEKENRNNKTHVNITHVGKTSTELSHSKIISEVLKKYPHIVKKNKNIKLKILAKNSTTDSAVGDSPGKIQTIKSPQNTFKVQPAVNNEKPQKVKMSALEFKEDGPWSCTKCSSPDEPCEFVLYYLYRKHLTDVHNVEFDPRMCKYCGQKFSRINMLMYHMYTRHCIKPPATYDFPKCSQCPYIALNEILLAKHRGNHSKTDLQCFQCKVAFKSLQNLTAHAQITGHAAGKSVSPKYDCQYCTKKFSGGASLFSHIKIHHRDEARRDGVVSIDEDDAIEDLEEEDIEVLLGSEKEDKVDDEPGEEYVITNSKKEKIKILSNVKVAGQPVHVTGDQQKQENVTESQENEAEVLTELGTSLGLVDIVVLDDNQQYILHSNEQHLAASGSTQDSTDGQSEFLIPDLSNSHTFVSSQPDSEHGSIISQTMLNNSGISSTDELVMVLTDHDYRDGSQENVSTDNSNIVVLYSHPAVGNERQIITTTQGNIVINSDSSVLIGNGTQNVGTQIESIEMILREIDSHGKDGEENKEKGQQAEFDGQVIVVPEPKEDGKEQEQVVEKSTNENEEVQERVEPMEVDNEEYCSVQDAKVTEENNDDGEVIMKLETVHVGEDRNATVESEGKETVEENVEQFLKESNTDESLSDAPMLTQQECYSSPKQNSQEDSTEKVENVSETDINVEDQNGKETEEESVNCQVIENVKEEQQLEEHRIENDVIIERVVEEEKTCEEVTETQVVCDRDTDKERTRNKEKDDKSSAKIILDEWEDTDSQQSGNKGENAAEVHKLIDDWEDEDDDDGGKIRA